MDDNTTLYLTDEEKTVFDKLSDELKEGWTVETAVIDYEETPQKQRIRFDVMNIQSPALQEFQEKAKEAKTKEEIEVLAAELDFSSFNDVDLTEIFYALGPVSIGILIAQFLSGVQSDEDIQGILGMSIIRNLLFGPK